MMCISRLSLYSSKKFRGVVGGVVIHHNHVVFEVGELSECAVHGVDDCLFPVAHGNHDGCLDVEGLLAEVDVFIVFGVYEGADLLKVLRAHFFHFYLCLSVARVHVVELLFSAQPGVLLLLGVDIFVQVENFSLAAQKKSQVVDAGVRVFLVLRRPGVFVQQLCPYEEHASEVEVVAQTSLLVVDAGVLCLFSPPSPRSGRHRASRRRCRRWLSASSLLPLAGSQRVSASAASGRTLPYMPPRCSARCLRR